MLKHPLARYLVRRFVSYIVSIWGAFTVAFFFFRLIPGDPIEALVMSMEQQYSYSIKGADEMIEEYKAVFGLQGNLLEQYIRYVKNVVFKLDLGPSLVAFPTHAQDLIARALPWTLGLLSLSVVISWGLGLIIGALLGWKRDTRLGSWLTNLALCFSQIPYYFAALLLVFLLAYVWKLFPPRGAYSALLKPGFDFEFVKSLVRHGFLPSLSLVLVTMFGWLISTRSLMISILDEDYLIFAQAKGLKEGRILAWYGLRNILLPQVTGLGMALGFILNGSYLVEWIFTYPGIGTLFVNAIGVLDYNTVQGVILLSIFSVLTANLVIDVVLPLLDPRVQYVES